MITIKRAHASDAETIAKLNIFVQKLHAAAFPKIFKPGDMDAEKESYFQYLLNNEKNYFFIAYIQNKAAGYIWARMEQNKENALVYANKQLYIHHVSVDEKYRLNGVGAMLMVHISDMAKNEHIETIAIDTWAFNENARQFFKKQGFETYNVKMWQIIQ